MEEDARLAAFQWIKEQVNLHGDVLPRRLLETGFIFRDHRINLVGGQGIWKPKVFKKIPLSITTVPGGPYDDSFNFYTMDLSAVDSTNNPILQKNIVAV